MKSWAVMHLERQVAVIREDGTCTVFFPRFMPYDLDLKPADEDSLITRHDNLEHFYTWCANRPLTLSRSSAVDFLVSHGYLRAATDRDRAAIALAYHGLCLTDVFWIRHTEENIRFAQIDLWDHPLSDEYVDVVLRDHGMVARNTGLARASDAALPKAYRVPNVWIQQGGSFQLLKGGDPGDVEAELVSSQIARCFDVDQVLYEPMEFEGRPVSRCELVTSKDKSIVFARNMKNYSLRERMTLGELIRSRDMYGLHMMNIIDYLIGNTDRNLSNWGFWIDNHNNQPEKLFPLMDFNRSFRSYDVPEGSQCLIMKEKVSQREAAVRGVREIGLRLVRDLPEDLSALFSRLNALRQTRLEVMFQTRLEILKQAVKE
ncbi:MAG: hypothetical protein K6A77_08745 [Clostridiales bacterium]|nr:hypothetical protein [Clostridiales bacterium]